MTSSAHLEEIWAEFMRTHSQAQRRLLIEAYVPLVKVTVDRLGIPTRSLLEVDDLIGYGMLGLINAIDRYDPTRGISFEAFASPRIRGAVIDQLRALNWFSRSALQRIKQVEQTMAELERRLGRPARDEEMAAALGVSLRRYRRMLQEVGTVILSLDSPLHAPESEGDLYSLGDALEDHATPEPASAVERRELLQALSQAIEHLPRRERLLLALYYVEGLSMSEIGKILGISQSRVSQLHAQTLLHLRISLGLHEPQHKRGSYTSTRSTSTHEHARQIDSLAHQQVPTVP
ncbi:sigma 28 (flagella/sporulation) [Thermogemmatispora aurantia]|uniref:Sigma 28 (Flagella/sporulation) n=1 Tax=Thermogemmatispora aurantia TaxID=2045279 RepID=A0A5J4K3W2_9CHLR|nr:FliA/WhiG family RNA polymerase sigma factor [Thermogemmatispora aurantia]GER83408.1 sigma 28 (flagella/sporulation) [Thermogemmatispora aurantia]